MKALVFKSNIKDNRILIPSKLQSQLKLYQGKDVSVIVLIDDKDLYGDVIFHKTLQDQFLKGYADSDSVYDNY